MILQLRRTLVRQQLLHHVKHNTRDFIADMMTIFGQKQTYLYLNRQPLFRIKQRKNTINKQSSRPKKTRVPDLTVRGFDQTAYHQYKEINPLS